MTDIYNQKVLTFITYLSIRIKRQDLVTLLQLNR